MFMKAIFLLLLKETVGTRWRKSFSVQNVLQKNVLQKRKEKNPMKVEVFVQLDRPARSKGADRYQGRIEGEDWFVYIPQALSRQAASRPVSMLTITIEDSQETKENSQETAKLRY